jgi:hypothetical protein
MAPLPDKHQKNWRSYPAQPRPGRPIACRYPRAVRCISRRGASRPWMKDQWHIGVQKSKLAAWPKRPEGMNHKAEGGIHGACQQADENLVKAQHDDTDMAKRRQQTRKYERAHKKSHAVMSVIAHDSVCKNGMTEI